MLNRLAHFFRSLPCPLTTIFTLSGLFFFCLTNWLLLFFLMQTATVM